MPPGHLKAFVDAVTGLPYADLTTEHFGAVHEHLARHELVDGKVQLRPKSSTVHFTPRSLTEPIVRTTLEPLLGAMRPDASILDLRICDPAVGAGAFLVELVRQLAQLLVERGEETDPLVAKRLVATSCCYGVDICRWAVASCKIALWLECRAEQMPPGWLDSNIKVGDGLVGLMNDGIAAFHWKPPAEAQGDLPSINASTRAVADKAMALGVELRKQEIRLLAQAARKGA